jgi:mitochondrial fission protein ELM1
MNEELPIVWVLEGEKRGDNAQVNEVARRLRATIVIKRLRYNPLSRRPNLLLGASLLSLDKASSDELRAPWPDMVIGIGRLSVPVARWIRRQSGGATRLVQLGRPRAPSAWFDLVLTTPQYGLPSAPNVIELALPFTPDISASETELTTWLGEFSDLPRPRIAVLIGGPTSPFLMGRREISNLSGEAEQLRRKLHGSVIAVGSPRTPPEALDGWESGPQASHRLFRWDPGRPNPYRSLLQIADRFVVTSDSVSMLAEAIRTGKPVDVFRLPTDLPFHLPVHRWPFSELVRRGFLRTYRNVDSMIARLVAGRHVGVLGDEPVALISVPRDEDRALARVEALLPKPSPRKDEPCGKCCHP